MMRDIRNMLYFQGVFIGRWILDIADWGRNILYFGMFGMAFVVSIKPSK